MVDGHRRLTCWEVLCVLQTCLDGELDPTSTRRVGRHLAQCHRCGRRATVFTAIKDTLARRKRPLVDPSTGANPAGDLPAPAVRRLREFAETLLDESGQ